jgi:hypothetical protein
LPVLKQKFIRETTTKEANTFLLKILSRVLPKKLKNIMLTGRRRQVVEKDSTMHPLKLIISKKSLLNIMI